jgi:hypothetical protein
VCGGTNVGSGNPRTARGGGHGGEPASDVGVRRRGPQVGRRCQGAPGPSSVVVTSGAPGLEWGDGGRCTRWKPTLMEERQGVGRRRSGSTCAMVEERLDEEAVSPVGVVRR